MTTTNKPLRSVLQDILEEVYDIGWNDQLDREVHGKREDETLDKAATLILKELEARLPEKFTDAEMDKATSKEFHIMYGYNKAIDDFRVLKGDDG